MNDVEQDYHAQLAWRQVQQCLPTEYRLEAGQMPQEDWWDWHGHRIHLDRCPDPAARARLVLFHGLGTNGRYMTLLAGAPLRQRGLDTVAPDLPGYGVTRVAHGATVRYQDWVDAACAFLDAERSRDPRPVFLYGFSAGGMLAYHVAAIDRQIAGIVGMTFIDPRDMQVRDQTASSKLVNRVALPLARLNMRLGLGAVRLPMRLVVKMRALVNDPAALQAFLQDDTAANNRVSQAFLCSYCAYQPRVEPEQFDTCPILLTQPAQDRWTPLAISERFLRRITRVPVEVVMLDNAGHFPVEQPGLAQMHDAIVRFVETRLRQLQPGGSAQPDSTVVPFPRQPARGVTPHT